MASPSILTMETLSRLVERYISPWFSTPSLFDDALPTQVQKRTSGQVRGSAVLCYNNLLRGDSSVSALARVQKLASRPLFYRLNYIRQLSTTNMAVNLDGSHNRLSHCLGTLDIASRFISILEKQTTISVVQKKSVLVYAFIHDCFHGPMGHSLDLVRDVLWGALDERVDKHLLLKQVDLVKTLGETGRATERDGIPLWRAINSAVADSESECEQIFQHLSYFADYQPLEEADPHNAFLREILDSDLDADRLDYIWRDHVHLTMSGLNEAAEIEDLISSVRVVEEGRERHLHYDFKHKDLVDSLLMLRVKYYSNYYEHPLKMVSDEMLSHALYYALDGAGAFDSSVGHKTLIAFADRFAYLTDDGLLEFLSEITRSEEQTIPRSLLNDFRTNKPFSIIYRAGLKRQELGHLTRRIANQQANLESIVHDEFPTIKRLARQNLIDFDDKAYRTVIEKFNNQVQKPTAPIWDADPLWNGKSLEYIPDEDIYHIQLICGEGFQKKFRLEKMLWEELLRKRNGSTYPFADALNRLAIGMAGEKAGDQEFLLSVKDRLREKPLIFITLSWIPGVSEADLINHKRGLSQGGIRFHQEGRPIKQQPELAVRSSEEDYFLLLSVPSLLRGIPGIEDLVVDTFRDLLFKRKWAIWGTVDFR